MVTSFPARRMSCHENQELHVAALYAGRGHPLVLALRIRNAANVFTLLSSRWLSKSRLPVPVLLFPLKTTVEFRGCEQQLAKVDHVTFENSMKEHYRKADIASRLLSSRWTHTEEALGGSEEEFRKRN